MKNLRKSAQSLIEYGLILALVALIALTVLSKLGKTVTGVGDKASNTMNDVSDSATNNYCASACGSGGKWDDTNHKCTGGSCN